MARENGAAIRRRETNGMTKAPGLECLEPRNIFYIIIRSVVTGFRLSRASRSFSFNSLAVSLPFFSFFFSPSLSLCHARYSFLSPFSFPSFANSSAISSADPSIPFFIIRVQPLENIFARNPRGGQEILLSNTSVYSKQRNRNRHLYRSVFSGSREIKGKFRPRKGLDAYRKGGERRKKKGRNASSSNNCSTSEIDFAYIICSVLFCLFPLGRNLEALFESRRFGISR